MRRVMLAGAALAALSLTGCTMPPGSSDPLVGFGPDPTLHPPQRALIPTVGVPDVVHWTAGDAPQAPPGFTVTRYAENLDHPRWAFVLPNGDVLISESASEAAPANKMSQGIRGYFQALLMKKVGSSQKSPNAIYLLRDADGDGVAETKTLFAGGLTRPFGMALIGSTLYVANDNGVVSYPYADGQTSETGPGTPVFPLPGGPINHHWTKNIVASPDGTKIYATTGSNSNVGDNGMAAEEGRAQIYQYDLASRQLRTFASGIRNPNGMAFEPTTNVLFTVSNERDEIGADTPPDYLTSVKDGAFYGWPYSYYGQHVDVRAKPARPDMVAKAIAPDYGLGPHTASLGLVFYTADTFPARYRGGAFIGQHGSWNRKPLNGYRVVFVPFAGGKPQMPAQVFLTGFLTADQKIKGRPTGVVVDKRGALLVVDDVGGIVWRVAPTAPGPR